MNRNWRSPSVGIGAIVRGFKSAVTKRIKQLRNNPDCPIWQRNYYERVIRNKHELNQIREYMAGNPVNWENDEEYKP